MNKYRKYNVSVYAIVLFLTVITVSEAWSQPQSNYVVPIIEAYVPTISDAFKINQNPQIMDTIYSKSKMFYVYRSKQYPDIEYNPEPIKPAKVQPDRLIKLYKNYIKLGFGNYITPYGEYNFNTLRSKNLLLGVHLRHLSSSGKIKNYAYSGCSDNEVNIYGKKIITNHTLFGNVDLNRQVVHYYGYNPDDYSTSTFGLPSRNDIKQRYLNVGFNAGIKSNFLDTSKLKYEAVFSYYHFVDKIGSKENNFRLNGNVSKDVKWVDFTKSQTVGVDVLADIYHNDDSLLMTVNGIVSLVPYIKTKYSIFDLKIGADLDFKTDVTTEMRLFPQVDLGMDLMPHYLYAFAGVTGGSKKMSYKSICNENPFVQSIVPLQFSTTKSEYFLGFKGNILSDFSFNLKGSYAHIEGMPFYVNYHDTTVFASGSHQFTIAYDTIDLWKAKAEVAYKMGEKIRFTVGADFYNYIMKNELKPWHRPNFDGYLSVDYNIQNKIIINGDFYYYGDMFARSYVKDSIVAKPLKGYLDANLGIEYRYSKVLSGFIHFNNLAGTRYYRWNNYPSYRFNILAGITYSFR